MAIEAAARSYWAVTHFGAPTEAEIFWNEAANRSVSDEEPPYMFLPDHAFEIAGTRAQTNNLGFRGSERIDLEAGGCRVVCLGDSVTFGYAVSDETRTYPAVLERLLRESGRDCQVINAGMPRYRVQHLAILYEDYLAELRPDVVVLMAGWNNLADQIHRTRPTRRWLDALVRYSYAVRMAAEAWPAAETPRHLSADVDAEGLAKYAAAVERIVATARDGGAAVYLATLPHFFEHVDSPQARQIAGRFCPPGSLPQLSDTLARMHRDLRDIANASGGELIDLGDIDRDEWFADAVHPNQAGSRRIAERVAAALLSSSETTQAP